MNGNEKSTPPRKIQTIREESKEMTRRIIVEAAERVLFRDGWVSATMESIAGEAGLTKGGVLYYYPSKNDLLAAALDRHLEKRREFVDARVAEAGPGVPVGRAALLAWLDFILGDMNYVKILGVLTADPLLRSRILESRRRIIEEWCSSCRNPVEAATLFSMVEGMILDRFHEDSAYPKDLRDQIVAKMRERIRKLK